MLLSNQSFRAISVSNYFSESIFVKDRRSIVSSVSTSKAPEGECSNLERVWNHSYWMHALNESHWMFRCNNCGNSHVWSWKCRIYFVWSALCVWLSARSASVVSNSLNSFHKTSGSIASSTWCGFCFRRAHVWAGVRSVWSWSLTLDTLPFDRNDCCCRLHWDHL